VADAVALFEPMAAQKEISLSAEMEPVHVEVDPGALTQVIVNLLNNALQYNHARGTVQVRLTNSDSQAVLTVTDTGCGIPKEDQPHIFERFYRVDKARSRASGGTGLGLAICKSIIESHGGTIGFESSPQQGSSFWVRLPLSPEVSSRNED
jgi:signal transduction histidine kinase